MVRLPTHFDGFIAELRKVTLGGRIQAQVFKQQPIDSRDKCPAAWSEGHRPETVVDGNHGVAAGVTPQLTA